VVLIKIDSVDLVEDEEERTKIVEQELELHTILLQNNNFRQIPSVLRQIRSLKVIQLYGNPCSRPPGGNGMDKEPSSPHNSEYEKVLVEYGFYKNNSDYYFSELSAKLKLQLTKNQSKYPCTF
jgi:hypothetical protein